MRLDELFETVNRERLSPGISRRYLVVDCQNRLIFVEHTADGREVIHRVGIVGAGNLLSRCSDVRFRNAGFSLP